VYSNVKEEESPVTLDEMKQAFRANVRLLLLPLPALMDP
jgi:hypothetical protein